MENLNKDIDEYVKEINWEIYNKDFDIGSPFLSYHYLLVEKIIRIDITLFKRVFLMVL